MQYAKQNTRKVIDFQMYNLKLLVVLGDSDFLDSIIENDYSYFYTEYMEHWKPDMNTTLACCINTSTDVIIYSDRIIDLTTMVHELTHATFCLCDNLGIPPFGANEPHAYMMEYLCKRVFEWYGVKTDPPKEKKLII